VTPRARSLLVILAGAAGVLLMPLAALAAGPAARDVVIDFQQPGPMRDLLGKSLGVAKSFLFLAVFAGYALEAFGRSPSAERDYGAVTWRIVVVLFLLWNYQPVFGSVMNLMDRIEREVAPPSTWEKLKAEIHRSQASLADLASDGEEPPAAANGENVAAKQSSKPSTFTSWVYEALIAVLQLLGEGLVFLIRWMSKILTATLFILGPLALVAGIPRMSSTGTRWFHRFVTIASWPIFAGVLLAVMVALGGQGSLHRSYLECLVASLVMLVTALSTPTLASHVVGGALQNFAAAGLGSTKSAHKDGVAPVARAAAAVAGGIKGVAVAAAASVAGRLAGGGAGGAGSGGGQGPSGGGGGQGGGVVANPPGPAGGGRGARGRGRVGGARGGFSAGGGGQGSGQGPSPGPAQGGVVANPPAPPAAPPPPDDVRQGGTRSPGGDGSGAR